MFGQERDYQIALGPVPPHPTTNGYLYSVLHSRGPGNVSNHQDDVVNALIEAQAAELDPSKRQERLLDLQRRVLDQAYMFSPITGSYRWVFDWNLQNFYPNTALSEYHYWSEAWLQPVGQHKYFPADGLGNDAGAGFANPPPSLAQCHPHPRKASIPSSS